MNNVLKEHAVIPGITDAQWCEAIIESVNSPNKVVSGITLPSFPESEITTLTTKLGASEGMLRSASTLYSHVKGAASKYGKPLDSDTNILDFGCGWGRIARFFLKEISLENIHGVEVLPELAEACNQAFGSKNFMPIEQKGKLPFDSGIFDIVFANSVFSHLDKELNIKWIDEINRVLKVDGMAMLTVIDEGKFSKMANSGSEWFNSLGFDVEASKEQLSAGEFIWRTTNRVGELDGYGFAVIPVAWIRENWANQFELLEVIEDYSQSIVVLKKY